MDKKLDYRAGLHAASHAVLHVVPLWVPDICDLHIMTPSALYFFP